MFSIFSEAMLIYYLVLVPIIHTHIPEALGEVFLRNLAGGMF
jgi:hypothetical protein